MGMFSVREKQQVCQLFFVQVVLIVLMGALMTYGPEADANSLKNHGQTGDHGRKHVKKPDTDPLRVYPSDEATRRGKITPWVPKSAVVISRPALPAKKSFLTRVKGKAEERMKLKYNPAHAIVLLFIEGFILCGFLATFEYAPEADASNRQNSYSPHLNGKPNSLPVTYTLYQDVHVMIWIGFGFLMTFLRRYGQSGIGLTFLLGAILIQVAMVCEGITNFKIHTASHLSLKSLLNADVAVATPLISMGALLGKTTYMQLVFMGILELIMFTVNKYVGEHLLMAVDAGDSMFVHVFGAYFGLAVSFVFGMMHKPKEHNLEGASYNSDIFAMIGTVFLWLFWPSFNSAALQGDDQQRAIINTLLSISSSCVIAFATSALVSENSKFNMVHVQNSTLAGGVAIGTAAGMMCQPVGALIVGGLAGVLSVSGYKYLTPLIRKRLRIHDTCGVHNLHGMPGVLGGIFGALMAGIATEASYDYSLYEIFPARAPNSEANLAEMRDNYGISAGFNRTAGGQAGYQLLVLLITMVIAIVSGLVTGLMMQIPIFGSISEKQKFDDEVYWDLEEEASQELKIKNGSDQLPMAHI